jgi:hypothetical protein
MLALQPFFFAIAVSCALICIARALPTQPISSSSNDICDCPQPDQCDEHLCPGGCFSKSSKYCIPAPAGFYAQLTNSSSANVEAPCESGSFTSVPGSAVCTACAAGQFARSAASISCDVCPAGTECPFAGMCLPFPCTAGTFSSTAGTISTQQICLFPIVFCSRSLPLCVYSLHRVPPWFLLSSHRHGEARSLSIGRCLPFRNFSLSFRRPPLKL